MARDAFHVFVVRHEYGVVGLRHCAHEYVRRSPTDRLFKVHDLMTVAFEGLPNPSRNTLV